MNKTLCALFGAIAMPAIVTTAVHAAILPCPPGGAKIQLNIDNRSGAAQSVTLSGALDEPACSADPALAQTYSKTATCPAGLSDCVEVLAVAPGVWRHSISVTVAGQPRQAQSYKTVVIADDEASLVDWTVFRSVFTIDRLDDPSTGSACPSRAPSRSCSFRRAIATAYVANKPALIQFDPVVFPAGTPTTLTLSQTATMVFASDVTLDATDPNGSPSFMDDAFPRRVLLAPRQSALRFDGADSSLNGLWIARPPLVNGAKPYDIVAFNGKASRRNRIRNCRIDGGAGSMTTVSAAHDCIEGHSGSGGGNFIDANVIDHSEIFACPDKGVKTSAQAAISVRDSYVHNNLDAGAQATMSGNLEVIRSVVESSGYNASTRINSTANGIAANGADNLTPKIPSTLRTAGNIVRGHPQRGISVNALSVANLNDDLVCGNRGSAGNGLSLLGTTANARATVRGSAFVFNGRNGATVADSSEGNFGTADSPGRNAFMYNDRDKLRGRDFYNMTTPRTPAIRNEWNGTGCATGSSATCLANAINATVLPFLPYRDSLDTRTPLAVQPSNPKRGETVHLGGSGFNAVGSYPAGGSGCGAASDFNQCPAVAGGGVCVQVEVDSGLWVSPPVRAVTPTHIVFEMPEVTCSRPMAVRVQQLDSAAALVTAAGTICTN